MSFLNLVFVRFLNYAMYFTQKVAEWETFLFYLGFKRFILAIGYYITPALVGGASGTLISNQIAFHMKSTLDWSFASAMGLMLLAGVLAIYWVYNKLVGIDNIKLG